MQQQNNNNLISPQKNQLSSFKDASHRSNIPTQSLIPVDSMPDLLNGGGGQTSLEKSSVSNSSYLRISFYRSSLQRTRRKTRMKKSKD